MAAPDRADPEVDFVPLPLRSLPQPVCLPDCLVCRIMVGVIQTAVHWWWWNRWGNLVLVK